MRWTIAALLSLSLTSLACGKGSTPSAPSPPPTPTVTTLSITGVDAVRTNFYAAYSAAITLSNGTTQDVTASASWTTSDGSLAWFSSAGRLEAQAHGGVTVTATYQGRTAQKTVSIVNNYGGSWTGTYVLTACDQSGGFAAFGWCRALGGVGVVLPFSLDLDQTLSSDRTQLAGTLSIGSLGGQVTGNVTGDGRLVLGGSYTVTSPDSTILIQVGGWDTRVSGSGGMTGRWALNLSLVGLVGNAYEECQIVSATHTAMQDRGRIGLSTVLHMTMDQLAAAMRTRR